MDLIRVFLDIGNILRLKLGSNKKYKIEEMADAISSIQYHNINGIKKIYETLDTELPEQYFVSLDRDGKIVKYHKNLGLFGISGTRISDTEIEVIIPSCMEV